MTPEEAVEIAALDFDQCARLGFGQIERPIGGADQPVDLEAERAEHAFHFAVLAFRERQCQPGIAALDALKLRVDRAETFALDRDALRKVIEPLLLDRAESAHPVAPEPAG